MGARNVKQRRGQLDVVRADKRVIELALDGIISGHIASELSHPAWAVQTVLEENNLFVPFYEVEKMCAHCGSKFLPNMSMQKFCRMCVPHGAALSRMKAYGISQPEVDALLEHQNDRCALCDKDVSMLREIVTDAGSGNIDAAIDHDHKTGAIRGIVCKKCNLVLAYVDRDGWLQTAVKYVESEPPRDLIVGDVYANQS